MNVKHWQFALAAVALMSAVACTDRVTPPEARRLPGDAGSRALSDGANGGNKDVWFLPPLVPNPTGQSGYGDPFQRGLPVVFKIVDLGAPGTPVIKALPAVAAPTDEFYQASWDTQNPVLNPDHNYRVEVWIGSRKPAFADVDVVTSGGLLKTVNSSQYIGLQDGRTLPLKVRVEKNWACINKASCVTEVVPAVIPAGEKFIVKSNDLLNAVAFEGTWHAGDSPVLVTIENITNQTDTNCGSALTIMRSSNSCIKFTADPPVVLTAPAVVATCLANPGDDRQMILKYDVGETPKFLEDVPPPIVCPEGTAMVSPNASRAMRLASAAMNKVSKAFRWVTNTRTAYAIDLGVGGRLEVGDDFSYFTLGLPSYLEAAAGQGQTGVINQTLAVDPKVRAVALHHHGDDPLYVSNLNMTCTIVGASGSLVVGASLVTSAPATNNGDGTYTCPHWKMPATANANTLRITTDHHDPVFLFPSEGSYSTVSGTFDFTATSVLPQGVINSINLTTTTLAIGGPNVSYTANLTNPGPGYSLALLQGEVRQGSVVHGAGGSNVVCGAGSGVFPAGACAHNFSALATNASGAGTLVPGPATLHFELKYFDGTSSTVLDTKDVPVTLAGVPTPALVYYSSEQYSTGGLDFDRYSFHVTNKASFSSVLFDPIPGATTCISHTLVNFYDAQTNAYIYGFCGLSSPTELDDIWFAVPRWTQPPGAVYIKLIDQLTNTVVATSNTVNLYGPLFRNYPRTLDLSWAAVPGAAVYTVTVEYCENWNAAGDWRICTSPWQPWTTTTVTAPTTHTGHTFVGDQPARWRVLSVDGSGNALPPTAYKYFNFITPP